MNRRIPVGQGNAVIEMRSDEPWASHDATPTDPLVADHGGVIDAVAVEPSRTCPTPFTPLWQVLDLGYLVDLYRPVRLDTLIAPAR